MITLRLAPGETAIVGYGSLLSPASLSSFLRRTYSEPFVTCYLKGWRRCWDIGMPNSAFYFEEKGTRTYPEKIIYLNVRPDPLIRMNVSLFVLAEPEFAALNSVE